MVVQAALLSPILRRSGRFAPRLDWRDPGVREVFQLLGPLVLSGLVVRWTPVVERFLASDLPAGSIATLGYAFLLTMVLSRLLATGISTVIFPRMAADAAGTDSQRLRRRMSLGMRAMWLTVAPFITIGMVLAPAVVVLVFRRGQFTAADAASVAVVLRVYLVALIGMCLGTITGRGFYALRDTRTLALFGVVEALAYAAYTVGLAAAFGLLGIAWGYVLYFNLSICWHVGLLSRRTGSILTRKLVRSATRTTVAALAAGAAAWAVVGLMRPPAMQVLAGGTVGLIVYGLLLRSLGSAELALILNPVGGWVKRRWART
jgi:putative peptidoglycan lipid II flippase